MLKSIRLLTVLLTVGLVAPSAGCAERPGPKKASAQKKDKIKKQRQKRERERKAEKNKAAKAADKKVAPGKTPQTGDAAKSETKPAQPPAQAE